MADPTSIPAAELLAPRSAAQRALYLCVADPGSLVRFGADTGTANPADWPGYEDQLWHATRMTGAPNAVTTAVATAAGERCVLVGFDFSFLGGSMGVAEGGRIARAFAAAIDQRLPVVCVAQSGGARVQEGTSALVQMQLAAAAIARARQAGIPHIAVAGDPTTGGVWSSLIASADVVIAVRSARVSFSGTRTRSAGADAWSGRFLADGQWSHGFADALVPEHAVPAEVGRIVRLLSPRSRGEAGRDGFLPAADVSPGQAASAGTDAWSVVSEARKPGRARAQQWLAGYFERFFEIRGDRCGGVDTGLRCGFGSNEGATIAYIAQTGQRTTPAGFRTAIRLLSLADRFGLPVLTLIDTPGAAAGPGDEAAGIGNAIAELLIAVASCRVPVTSIVIGEGGSGGALALASPGRLWMAQGSYLAVTAPELAASILKLPASDIPGVAARLRLTPAELISRGIARGIAHPPART